MHLHHSSASRRHRTLTIRLSTGERVPAVVTRETLLPVRLGLRWIVLARREYVGSAATLGKDAEAIARVYDWSEALLGLDLDDHLTGGGVFDDRQLASLAVALGGWANDGATIDSGTEQRMTTVVAFLTWCLDPSNRGGRPIPVSKRADYRDALLSWAARERTSLGSSEPVDPLTEAQVAAYRQVLAPEVIDGAMHFPRSPFRQGALRNWVMFETCLQLGLRRGEMLKLRLDSLAHATTREGLRMSLRVIRYPDDVNDDRLDEPAVKTAERAMPLPAPLLEAITAYMTAPAPMGRGTARTPYLFVTTSRRVPRPLSPSSADKVIRAAASAAGLKEGAWHRLRYTWACDLARRNRHNPQMFQMLKYLGGWSDDATVERYVRAATAEGAHEDLAAYHALLPHTRALPQVRRAAPAGADA